MLKLRPQRITLLFALMAAALLIANCGVLLARYLGYDHLGGLVPLFDMDLERNFPTFFAALLAVVASGLLLAISMVKKQMMRPWKLWASLSGIFLLVAMDEFIGIHEQLSQPLRELLDAKGLLYFAWIIPYGLLAMLLAGIYGRFVFEMPIHIRNGLLLSATLFLGGALGFEMLSGMLFEQNNRADSLLYGVMSTVRESLELGGIILFINTLLWYIEDVQKNILIQLGTYDPMARIIKEAQRPLPQSVFRMDNSNRAEP
ncbi:MAG TPA: hypothetical protein VEA39_00010 [Methylophilaceae bacterium]|nr:hypothetical protein [Methylophilaceae bacterium]